MSVTEPISFIQYLEAKKTVDDQSLNQGVWDSLANQLRDRSYPLRILEAGAGIGTMIARALERNLFEGEVFYRAIDTQPDNAIAAPDYLTRWADASDAGIRRISPSTLQIQNDKCTLHVSFHTADAFRFITTEIAPSSFDLLIAHAFIDLVHIPTALPKLFAALKPDGLFYFSIVFDGITAFEPTLDVDLDTRIEQLYHADMEKRRWENHPTGGSQAGRRLLRYLLQSEYELLAAGASDWVVTPHKQGYAADEGVFLHSIIQTIDRALASHAGLDIEEFSTWIQGRHQQITNGELMYIAHQLDVLGRL